MTNKSFNNIPHLILELEGLTKEALKEIGITVKADMQSNCVVHEPKVEEKYNGIPGTLRRSHAFRVAPDGKSVKIGITPSAPYGVYVEFKPYKDGGRPWIRKTIQQDTILIKEIIKKHLRGIEK